MSKFNLLEGNVNAEMLEKLMAIYEDHQEEYVIYFSAEGGRQDIGDVIIDLIDLHGHCTTLIGTGFLLSMGFEIFYRSKCKKILKQTTVGMVHAASIYGKLNHVSIIDKITKTHFEHMVEREKESKEFYKKLGLSKSEMKIYDSGEDVVLSYTRMKELLNNSKK